jgi:hypothetical protein
MSFKPEHEIYKRRFSRNLGLGLALSGFVLLGFFLTVEKVTRGHTMDALEGKPYVAESVTNP